MLSDHLVTKSVRVEHNISTVTNKKNNNLIYTNIGQKSCSSYSRLHNHITMRNFSHILILSSGRTKTTHLHIISHP